MNVDNKNEYKRLGHRITASHDRAWKVFQWYLSPMGQFFFFLKSTASRWLRKASFYYGTAVEILGMRLDVELHFRPDHKYEEAQGQSPITLEPEERARRLNKALSAAKSVAGGSDENS